MAFGLERWLLAVLVTYGVNPADWPFGVLAALTAQHIWEQSAYEHRKRDIKAEPLRPLRGGG